MDAKRFPEARFFRLSEAHQLWRRYCGFLDLSLKQFMEIQEYLLLDQVQRMAGTPVGAAIMKGARPASVEAFRRTVPITTYRHYAPLLQDCRETALTEAPYFWCHSPGRGGDYKWVPYTQAAFDRIARYAIAAAILAAAEAKGEVRLRLGDRLLLNIAPRPYASGTLLHHLAGYFPYQPIPPLDMAEDLDFVSRTELAYKMALRQGVDYIFSTASVLTRIGEKFADQERRLKCSPEMLHPQVLARLLRAWLRTKLGRRRMLPRDLWSPKGLVTFGVDSAIYQDEVARMWGKLPYQVYGTTELLIGAVQGWNKKGLIFVPDLAFWEFIPLNGNGNGKHNHRHNANDQPPTVLVDELEVGKRYELVYTHFYGMPLIRYRIGDVFKVEALEDPETGVKLPQLAFQCRADEVIDLAGVTQIDEKTLWQAIEQSGVRAEEWCARKEVLGKLHLLRLFIELKEEREPGEVEELVEQQLRKIDVDYRDLEGWLGQRKSVAVTLLAPGAFARYVDQQIKAGVPPMELKPPHINPSDVALARLAETRDGVIISTLHQPALTPTR